MYAIRSYYACVSVAGSGCALASGAAAEQEFPMRTSAAFADRLSRATVQKHFHPIEDVDWSVPIDIESDYRYLRITSYNVCYTKLLRERGAGAPGRSRAAIRDPTRSPAARPRGR